MPMEAPPATLVVDFTHEDVPVTEAESACILAECCGRIQRWQHVVTPETARQVFQLAGPAEQARDAAAVIRDVCTAWHTSPSIRLSAAPTHNHNSNNNKSVEIISQPKPQTYTHADEMSQQLTVRLSGGEDRQQIGYRGVVQSKAKWTALLGQFGVRAVTSSAKKSCDFIIIPDGGRASFSALKDAGMLSGEQANRSIETGTMAKFVDRYLTAKQRRQFNAALGVDDDDDSIAEVEEKPAKRAAAASKMKAPPSPRRAKAAPSPKSSSKKKKPVAKAASSSKKKKKKQPAGGNSDTFERTMEQIEALLRHAKIDAKLERRPGMDTNSVHLIMAQ
jgi:hypothetical protein